MSLWVIAAVAVGVTVASQLISRYMLNQSKIQHLKEEAKKLSAKLKKLDPTSEEFKEIQDRILDINSELMKENFKTWPVTMTIFILAFFVLSNLYAYENIAVGSPVNLEIVGSGTFNSSCLNLSMVVNSTYKGQAIISENPCFVELNGKKFEIEFNNRVQEFKTNGMELKVTPQKRIFINLPFSLPIVGNKIGWLGTYIIFSLITSIIVTKILDKLKVGRW